MLPTLRILFLLVIVVPVFIVVVPIQFVLTRLKLPFWNILPGLIYWSGCTLVGLRVHVLGTPEKKRATLLVANHISWMDILAVGLRVRMSFVSKSDVAKWPLVGFLASLQKTIFVDRTRRSDAKRTSNAMAVRMAAGDALFLFAEGGTGNSENMKPFRSALIGASLTAMGKGGANGNEIAIQPVAISYTNSRKQPLSQQDRAALGWNKAVSLGENVRNILSSGTKDVVIVFGKPVALVEGNDRKQIAKFCETEVRNMLIALKNGEDLSRSDA